MEIFELLFIIGATPQLIMKTEIPKNNKNADSYYFVTHHYYNDHN